VTRDEILQAIGEVAREHLVSPEGSPGAPAGELERRLARGGRLPPDLRLVEDLALDSIQLLTLAVEVENRFRICMDPEDEEGIESVGDLADVVARKLAAGEDERDDV
jgi:acyl carrier protein